MKLNLRKAAAFFTMIAVMLISATTAMAQEAPKQTESKQINQEVEASCGQCKFGLTGKKGCDLAVRIDGKAYFVDGVDIHHFGDAHGERGFCNTVRHAQVKGELVDGRFKAKKFKLTD